MTPFQWPMRVYYEDTDAGGVVYYANYLKFLERARTEWLRSISFEQQQILEQQGVLFAVRGVSVEYRKPARLDDQLKVSVEVKEVRKASMSIDQTITNSMDELIVMAQVNIVCLHRDSFKPSPVPKLIYEALKTCI